MPWTAPIGKNQVRVYAAAYGGGNVSGGGPYDSSGGLVTGAIEFEVYPTDGDLKVSVSPRPVVVENHNGEPTGKVAHGDPEIKSLSLTLGGRAIPGTPAAAPDATVIDFLLGRHPTAISTDSDAAASADYTGAPFRFWLRQEVRTPDGAARLGFAIWGHCFARGEGQQGESLKYSLTIDVAPPPWTSRKDGIIYAGI